MRGAARIAAAAHRRAMQATRPGRREYEIEAELLHEFRRNGAQFPAYSPIVAGGPNACVLHYVFNDAPLRDGELLLIDAGCELDGYASDITRTFPVGGRFSPGQREATRSSSPRRRRPWTRCAPGGAWNEPHDAAVRVLAQGMLDLKLLREAWTKCSRRRPTSASTCTAPDTGSGSTCTTQANTSAPGSGERSSPAWRSRWSQGSTSAPADDVPERLRNIGIRIEDDVVVTQGMRGHHGRSAQGRRRNRSVDARCSPEGLTSSSAAPARSAARSRSPFVAHT